MSSGSLSLQSSSSLPSKHTLTGRYRSARETPFDKRFSGGPIVVQDPMLARFADRAQKVGILIKPCADISAFASLDSCLCMLKESLYTYVPIPNVLVPK